ncbi:MAG: hypothetical protein VX603_18270 [Gemmatimonadota bacterium]|nr:hypothetical protein [Gemmatimonadota bacterium]
MRVYYHLAGLFILGLVTFISNKVQAEPYLAVREGLMCSACHVNQTGIGMRTLYGVEFTQSDMPIMETVDMEGVLDRDILDFISIGGDVRLANTTRAPDVGGAKSTNTFGFNEGNLYAKITIKQDRFYLYVDEAFAPGTANNRELVGILEGLPNSGYLKVGRMSLPYGWRLWDFGFTRSQPGFLGQDFGVEIGFEPGTISFQAAISNGEPFGITDSNTGKQFTTRLATVHSKGRIGASFTFNSDDPTVGGKRRTFVAGGPHIGVNLGPIAVLGEAHFIRAFDGVKNDFVTRIAAYGEANVLLSPGVNGKVAFDYFDPKNGNPTAKRLRIGLEPTITEFMQLRVFYEVMRPRNFADPLFGLNPNQDVVTLELHMMF